MEDGEGLSFDFEGGLDAGVTQPSASVPAVQSSGPVPSTAGGASDQFTASRGRTFRQTVCRHWLRGLCMKGESCGFLHQYDQSRMPVCRFFRLYGECREQDCVYKHSTEDIKECHMYNMGFCPNGPYCRYKHAKLPGPPPPVEEVLQKMQQLTSHNYGKFHQQRVKSEVQPSNIVNQGAPGKPSTTEFSNIQRQQQKRDQQSQQQVGQNQIQNTNQTNRAAHPLPQGVTRYFIVKSCNRENLELSVQQGVWATQWINEAKLNEAFDSVENVILIFSVNRTRHFQGCAKMTSRIGGFASGGNWKKEHATANYGRNFSVKWLKLCELSFDKTQHLRNPYNQNLPVKISRDCQELEPSVGSQLASLLYLEPDSELMAISLAAESKREEDKAKGVDTAAGADNPDIVPFEDDDEEEEEDEEESDEEEEGSGAGRGRGTMWPPQMLPPHAARPVPGIRAFPPGMMGGGFGMPRPFEPYGAFPGPMPGMMFPGRPPQPGPIFRPPSGFGAMMGPGMGPAGRGGRPPNRSMGRGEKAGAGGGFDG